MTDVKAMLEDLKRADIAAVKIAKVLETANLNVFAITELMSRILALCIERSESPYKTHYQLERMLSASRRDARDAFELLRNQGFAVEDQPMSIALSLSLMINRRMVMDQAGISKEEQSAYTKKLADSFDTMIANVMRGWN